MKCLRKYKWLKLHRACLPAGRGIMGYWAKLASRAAFRKGYGVYCGFRNPVEPGMWAGGIVGLKSILGVKRRQKALWIMHELEDLGYLKFTHDLQTKKVTYQICDWEHACSGGECEKGAVYATDEFGFLGMPRTLTDRLADSNRIFDEADAWLDLWCHTTYRDYGNAFSFLGPAIQFGKYGSVLTLEGLGRRWNWEKTKVWRFFQKNESTFIVKGLEDDNYTVTEVRTGDGYTLLKDDIKIVISQVETTELCDIYASDVLGLVQNDPRYATIINDTGDLKNMPQKHLEHHLLTASATVDGNDVNMLEDDGSINAVVPLKVVNTRGFDLPQTGDHGTWMFSVIGIMLMAGAAVVIIMTSRKKRTTDQ